MEFKFKKEYLVIFIIQVTEVLGFSLVLPFLPLYAQSLGATPLVAGSLLASFSFFQFFSAPIMGRLSDHYGRKPLLIFSQLSTFLGFIILGLSSSLWMIFLSRIVDGLLGSNATIAQAYLSDVSPKKDRTRVFGLSGMAFGLGFLIGPAIGGFLSRYGYGLPAFIAAGFSMTTVFMTAFLLKETVSKNESIEIKLKILDIAGFKKFFLDSKIASTLWQFAFFILAHMIWTGSFALYAERQLGFGASEIGFLLTYIGLISIILRGVILGKLIKLFSEQKLRWASALAIIIGLFSAAFVSSWPHLLLSMTFFAFGAGLIRPLLMGSVSRKVSPQEQGAVLGVVGSLGSLAQIIGPLLGGFLISRWPAGILGIAGGLVAIVGLGFFLREAKLMKVERARHYFKDKERVYLKKQ